MNALSRIFGLAILATSVQVSAQAPAPTAGSSKPISTSLGMVVFPAKQQTAQQQSKDESECYAWSKNQTGVDPSAPVTAPPPATAPAKADSGASGARVKGAARGAAAGAVIGEVANDDAGEGAAIGAAAGVVAGGRQSRKAKQEAEKQATQQTEQAAQQQAAATQEQLGLFKKGFAACLEPKGYTVK